MKIKTQEYDELTVVELQGEMTSDFTEMLRNTLENVVSKRKPGIILDMSQVAFVDSKGLELLLWARDYSNENSCAFKVAGLTENCEKILEITGLYKEFDKYAELSQAVRSMA
ncbi:MAG: hypothetical protein A2Y07_04815 [Planctomycetes bacterium GWF2_50_10]|nr:MAG: hypothetical protein A2Y07_04815 [Planctomycetes bacterium GWF2_50_10]